LGEDNRILIDCNGFRKEKDAELKQMAHFIAGKAKNSGVAQEMGPLNPYERRIVHLAIAEDPTVSSESIGDAFMKTVIISVKS
jgi:spoIIIJ-associated protein